MPKFQDLLKTHLKNFGIDEAKFAELIGAESDLDEEDVTLVNSTLGKLMTEQVAINTPKIRDTVIKDIMSNAENSIFDFASENKFLPTDFITEIQKEKRLSEKVKKTLSYMAKNAKGSKKVEELQKKIDDLQKKLDSGDDQSKSRIEAMTNQLEELKLSLQEKEDLLKVKDNEHFNFKLDSFLSRQLNKYELKDNKDPEYRSYLKRSIIQKAKTKAHWVLNDTGEAIPKNKENPDLDIYGNDQVNPHTADTLLFEIAKDHIIVNPNGGGQGGNGRGKGNSSSKYQSLENMTETQRKRVLAARKERQKRAENL